MAHLPNHDPWHAWTNFEFVDDESKVNEVDVLVLRPTDFFLIEIKSRRGVVAGDTHTWPWARDGKQYSYHNPLIPANRKAKRLASALRKLPAVQGQPYRCINVSWLRSHAACSASR